MKKQQGLRGEAVLFDGDKEIARMEGSIIEEMGVTRLVFDRPIPVKDGQAITFRYRLIEPPKEADNTTKGGLVNLAEAIDNLPEEIEVTEGSLNLEQESDTNQEDDLGQYLKIEFVSNGVGIYAVLSSERWAVDGGEELRRIADIIDAYQKLTDDEE